MKKRKRVSCILAWMLTFLICFNGSISYAFLEGIEGISEARQEKKDSTATSSNGADISKPPQDELEEDDMEDSQDEETMIDVDVEADVTYDPQPTTMAEVQEAIEAYEAEYQAALEAEGLLAALKVQKPHWEYEVTSSLMPEGWRCDLVDWDEDFGAVYYTFFDADVEAGIIYDPQPATMAEVQEAIEAYEAEYQAALEAEGVLAALEVQKPRWKYEVASSLMPVGWRCDLVDWDEDFGAVYYTFFPAPNAMAYGTGYVVEPPIGYGTDISDYFNIISGFIDSQYSNVAVITVDDGNQYGAMWAKEKLDLTLPFKTEMYLHLGHEESNTSPETADGMTFTMHNDPAGLNAIGGVGEGLGVYKGRKSDGGSATTPDGTYLRNSLVIEFDTYTNDSSGAFVDDPEMSGYSAHCALVTPEDDLITKSDHKNVFYFNTMQDWVKVEVEWEPDGTGGGMLTYSLQTATNESSDYTVKTYTIANVNATFGGTKVFWGFTGTTGGFTALQAAAMTKLPTQEFLAKKTVTDSVGADIDGGQANVGDVLRYNITVTAEKAINGIGTLTITDELSAYVKYVEGSVTITTSDASNPSFKVNPTFVGNTMTIDTGHILKQVEDWLTVTFDVMVIESGMGETVENTAIAIAENLTEPQSTNTTEVEIAESTHKIVDSGSEAGAGGSTVSVGDEITYRIGYLNTTGETADLIITDTLEMGLDFVSATGGGIYDPLTRTVTWPTITGVAAGSKGSVTVTVKVNSTAGAEVTNKATLSWDDGTNPPETEEPATTNPVGSVKHVASGSTAGANGAKVSVGDKITYEIEYRNITGRTADLTITDKLEASLDFMSATGGGTYDPSTRTVIWPTITGVTAGSKGSVTVTVKVNSTVGAEVTNKATLSWDDGVNPPETEEPVTTNPAGSVKRVASGSKAGADGARVGVGDEITYEIEYRNITGGTADLTITDKLETCLDFMSATGGGTYAPSTRTVTWPTITGVTAGSKGSVTVTVKVNSTVGAEVTNKAALSWDDGVNPPETEEPATTNPAGSVKRVASGSTAGADGARVGVGDEITYEIEYRNTTGRTANLTITDKLEACLDFVSAAAGGTYNPSTRTVTWPTIAGVAAGGSGSVTVTVKVNSSVGAEVTNKATLSWDDGVNPPETEEPATTNPAGSVKRVASGSTAGADGARVGVGDEITYEIEYRNITGGTADLTITDKLEAYLDFVSATGGGTYDPSTRTVTWPTITGVAAGGSGSVTVTVKVNSSAGAEVTNKATLSWDDGTNPPGTENPKTTNPVIYNLMVQAETGGSADTTVNGSYIAGSVVTITATANSGYSFKQWTTNNGGSFANAFGSTTTFTMPAANVILTASFTRNTGGGGGGGGGTTPTPSQPGIETSSEPSTEDTAPTVPESVLTPGDNGLVEIPGNPPSVIVEDPNGNIIYEGPTDNGYLDTNGWTPGTYTVYLLDNEGVPRGQMQITITDGKMPTGLAKTGDTSLAYVLLMAIMLGTAGSMTTLVLKRRKEE